MSAELSEIKACCAASYAQDVVALVLGECYHPSGLAPTRRVALALGLRAGQRVVDVAAGPGAQDCGPATSRHTTTRWPGWSIRSRPG
jgi:arsenite methyltransferase